VKDVIEYLSGVVGERFGGSEGDRRAAGYVAERFRGLGLEVELQEFSYIGWRPLDTPSLRVFGSETDGAIDCSPLMYAAPTPGGGLRGRLVNYGTASLIPGVYDLPAFSLVDAEGRDRARIIVELSGPAIPLINPRAIMRLPQVVVGSEARDRLAELAADGGATLELHLGSELVPDARSGNVIGRYSGSDSSQVAIVCAHLDTTIGTPGAYDNASGVAGLLGVAEQIVARRPDLNVEFIALACEEQGFHGASHYVTDRRERGRLGDVLAVVNLDQISGGDFLWVWAGPEPFAEQVRATLDPLPALAGYEVRYAPPMPGADDWMFAVEGVPTVSLIFWRLPVYHKPHDTMEHVDMEKVHAVTDAALALLQGIEGRHPTHAAP
jgi:aminopeptidase YwaD